MNTEIQQEKNGSKPENNPNLNKYGIKNLQYVGMLLAIWFSVSFGCGILFVDELDHFKIAGFKLGFWFAQQGSIYVFVLLIFVYVWLMNRLDQKYNVDEGNYLYSICPILCTDFW